MLGTALGVASFLAQVAAIVVALWTIYLWREAKETRRAAHKPIVVPVELGGPVDLTSYIFAYNFSFPRQDAFTHTGVAYVGLKNIGPGPALDVRVARFEPSNGPGWTGVGAANIAAGLTVPVLVRFGYSEDSFDLDGVQRLQVEYKDVFGGRYSLHLDLWFKNLAGRASAEAVVVAQASGDRAPERIDLPVFRYLELRGYWDVKDAFRESDGRQERTSATE